MTGQADRRPRRSRLERQRREAEALREVAATVNRSLDSQEVLQAAVEAIADAVDVDAVLIRTLDAATGRLTLAASVGLTGTFDDGYRVLPFGQGLSGHVILTDSPAVIDDARNDPRLSRDVALREGMRSVAVLPIRARASVVGTVATFTRRPRRFAVDDLQLLQSIADQVGIALENARLYEAERARASELERLGRLKAEFAQTVSHELRTPMTIVKTSFDALQRDWATLPESRRREYVRIGQAGADRLKRLLENLLLASGLEESRIHLQLTSVDLAGVIDQVLDDAAASGRRVETTLPGDLPSVAADPRRLADVLGSLVENALRYSSAPAPVTVTAAQQAEKVVVAVRDRGIGIAAEDMPRLFHRFERIDPRVRAEAGTGLGLYISRRLVEVMGGRIWAESQPGAGSTFFVELAVARS